MEIVLEVGAWVNFVFLSTCYGMNSGTKPQREEQNQIPLTKTAHSSR